MCCLQNNKEELNHNSGTNKQLDFENGLIWGTAVDVHVDTRKRWPDMYKALKTDTSILGISISEKTAAIFKGGHMEVSGPGKVGVFDWEKVKGCSDKDSCWTTLTKGDWYDVCDRKI